MSKRAKTKFSSKNEANEYFLNKKFEVTSDYSNYKKGEIITIVRINYGSPIYLYKDNTNVYITPSYLKEVPITIFELEKEIEELQKEIEEKKSIISFMKENKLEIYDKNEFKVYQVLSKIESTDSKIEKAKFIAALINN